MSNLPTITDVQARRAQIASLRADLARQDLELAQEDTDLSVAERALLRLSGTAASATNDEPQLPLAAMESLGDWATPGGWKFPNAPRPSSGTLEQIVEWLLMGAVNPWADARQIQAALSSFKNKPVPMSSVSPTLTAMKDKGILVRDGFKVALAIRAHTNRAAAE